MINLTTTINKDTLDFENLTQKQKQIITQKAIVEIITDNVKKEIKANMNDFGEIINQWLHSKKSIHTQRAYKTSLKDLEEYAKVKGIKNIVLIEPMEVDNWILYLKDKGYSNNAIRLKISSISSLFKTLTRYDVIPKNPFIGVDLPKKEYKKSVKEGQETIPIMSKDDYKIIIDYFIKDKEKPLIPLAIHFMARYGLRVGALPSIKIHDDYFSFTTKGDSTGTMALLSSTQSILKNTTRLKSPFKTIKKRENNIKESKTNVSNLIAIHIYNKMKELVSMGSIKYKYSPHDFRHFFAVNHYKKYKDIYALKKLLGHASLNVTDIYLQSLQVESL